MGELIVSTDTNPTNSADPTVGTYAALIEAYEHFNVVLFDNQLSRPLLSIRNHGNADGYYSPRRFVDNTNHEQIVGEIAINPRRIADHPVQEVMSTLVHETVHHWQHCFGKPSRNGYHNRQWASMMKSIGLQPSSTGKPGGAETGQRMSDFIITGGRFDLACSELIARGFTLRWADITRERERQEVERPLAYTCPGCGEKVRGKPGLRIACVDCSALMIP
jgi:predicted SprT family Zn-dependent metalloprotease